MAETEFDVIVIGGGIAGMVTANRAAELGKRVAVLEKSTEEQYICNSRYTYGTFHINFTSPDAAEDELVRKVEDVTEGYARKDIARAVAKEGRRLMQWLRGQGIELNDLGQYHTHVLSPVQRSGAGLKWNGFAGDVALKRLEANFRSRQGRMLRGTRVTGLKLVPGGIEIETGRRRRNSSARSVVIADGGFQANPEMVRRAHLARARPAAAAPRRHGHRRRLSHGEGARRRDHLRDGQLLRPSAQPRGDDRRAAVAASAGRRSRRGRHRRSTRRASASPTKAMAASISPTPSPACPTRSARPSSSIRRSGTARPAAATCSRPIRWCRRPAARCIAPTRSRRSRR